MRTCVQKYSGRQRVMTLPDSPDLHCPFSDICWERMEGAEVAAGQLRSPESGVDHRPVPPKGLQELLELLDGQSCDRPVA